MKDDRVYLAHILECIAHIEEDTRGGKEEFLARRIIQDAVLRNLHTLTESTQHLSEGLRAAHPEVQWRQIAAFRNVVVHDYLGIDLPRVWDLISKDLPLLKAQIQAIARDLRSEGGAGRHEG